MRRIRASLALVVALVLAFTGLATVPATAATPDDDVNTIVTRLQEYYLAQGDEIIIANGIYLARVSEAQEYAASQNPDGSWSDVNYADRTSSANGATWSAYIALYRMLAMAYAYRDADAKGFEAPALVTAVDRALTHWDAVDPGNQNWWETEIGESMAMGRISIFLGGVLSDEAFAASLKHNTGKLDPVGANGAWRTTNYLFEAVASRNFEDIASGFDTMAATVAVDDSGNVNEAVQPDASFWAHEAQLYSEGYGMALFTNVALWADAARGTSLGFTRAQLDDIAFYIINGTRWMIRGEVGMLYLGYRPPKTIDGVTSYASEFLEPLDEMARTDALYATQYRALADNIRGKTPGNGVTGDKYFWRSEFSSHVRDEYAIFTRLNSSRTIGAEYRSTFRPEVGNEVFWNSASATAIQVNNREYLDLGPAFDWFHYPGVTAPYAKEQTRGTNGRVGNGGSFTGGVSDGHYGANVYTLDRAKTKGLKSTFLFDDEMVALGTGIGSTADAAVHSVVNQAAAKDNAMVDGKPVADGADGVVVDDPAWAYNDEVGYVFPSDAPVTVSNKAQTGSWVGEDAVSRDAFTLYFDHGTKPTDAGYEYIVLPAASPAEVERYAAAPAVRILQNDASVQAVQHAGLQRTMATFFQAGALDLGDGRTLEVTQPAIVILDESGAEPVVSIANPDKPGLVVAVTLRAPDAVHAATFALGSGPNLGKTVTASLTPTDGAQTSAYTASSSAEGRGAALAGDGDAATSWASADGEVQWVAKDLGAGAFVTGLTLEWGAEAATRYLVQTSQDGANWSDLRFVQNAEGGTETLEFPPTAATYLRVLLLESAGGSGYSIAEMSVQASRNLALGRSVTASGGSAAGSITDGNMASRWSANLSDTAWTQVDLGSVQPIGTVRLWWEASYAKQYRIQVSDDQNNWRDAYVTPSGGSDGGLDVIAVQENARYVRMQSIQRSTTQYGVSIWEMEVFEGDAIASAPTTPVGRENLALGRPTTAESSYNATLEPRFATDGIGTTRWASRREDAPYKTERWLQVDLEAPRTVNQAVLTWESATSNDFRLEGSLDGQTWQELVRVQKTSAELKNTVDFADAEVRYVRVAGLPVTKYGISLFEFELYGGYNFSCTSPDVSAAHGDIATVTATIAPLDVDDVFTAYPVEAAVARVEGAPRVGQDGSVAFDLRAGESGSTRVLLTHAKGDEISWCTVNVAVDTAALQELVDRGNALDSNIYTADSWRPVLPALEAAKEALRTSGIGQSVIDQRAEALRAALDGLVEIGQEPEVTVPSAPASLTATAEGSAVIATWLAPEDDGGAAVSAYELTIGDRVIPVGGDVLTGRADGLAPGTYAVSVRAQNEAGWSPATTPVSVEVVEQSDRTPTVTASDGLRAGGKVTVTGVEFTPGAQYLMQLRSSPRDLGTVTADAAGAFTLTADIPVDVPGGAHTIVVMRDGVDIASVAVQIEAAAGGGTDPQNPQNPQNPAVGALPSTGADLAWAPWTAAAALLMLTLGGALVLDRRRRRAGD
ncbi:discoidin domain-containing protein [Microbacterium binotii]|uniref:discoidin domain-containing protein n=1 Tax=Microbacterium binotii TaxID=462710 RepID=UPI001F22B596|nr:discoidin domain-containing protein [Microbacterium binotii]UIN30185.1 discoidin domain-containing protein [Microbacterium binotii]